MRRALISEPETIEEQRPRLEGSYRALLRARAEGDPSADARLGQIERQIEELAKGLGRDAAQSAVLQEDAAERARLDAEAERHGKVEQLATVTAQGRAHAVQVEQDMDAGVIRLDRVNALLACAREAYALHLALNNRELRSAKATPERLGEWLAGKLGLAIPWSVQRARREMSLTQLLGLDGANT
jgi:hypothetical protein